MRLHLSRRAKVAILIDGLVLLCALALGVLAAHGQAVTERQYERDWNAINKHVENDDARLLKLEAQVAYLRGLVTASAKIVGGLSSGSIAWQVGSFAVQGRKQKR